MSIDTALGLMAGLKELNDQFAAQQTVVDELIVKQYRPRGTPQPPALYAVVQPADMEPADTVFDVDTLTVAVRIAVLYTDVDSEMDKLLRLTDQYRPFIDRALKSDEGPLGGADVRRMGFRVTEDLFDQVQVLAVEFPIRARLEALNPPAF